MSRDRGGKGNVGGRAEQAILGDDFLVDLEHWTVVHPKVAARLVRLIREIIRIPFTGIGKPEPMRHAFAGCWSRRLTDEARVVYAVRDEGVYFYAGRWHYEP